MLLNNSWRKDTKAAAATHAHKTQTHNDTYTLERIVVLCARKQGDLKKITILSAHRRTGARKRHAATCWSPAPPNR